MRGMYYFYELNLLNGETITLKENPHEQHYSTLEQFREVDDNHIFIIQHGREGTLYIPKRSIAYIREYF